MSLDFPLSVKSRIFFFVSEGERGCVFGVFFPCSRDGNSGLHSTRFNYSRFYGRISSRFVHILAFCKIYTIRFSSERTKEEKRVTKCPIRRCQKGSRT